MASIDTLSKLNAKSTYSLDASERSGSLLIQGRLTSKKEKEVMKRTTSPIPALAASSDGSVQQHSHWQLSQLGILEEQMHAASQYLHRQRR